MPHARKFLLQVREANLQEAASRTRDPPVHPVAVLLALLHCNELYNGGYVRRVDIRSILADPEQRRRLMVDCIIALQAREGIEVSREQAEAAYDEVQKAAASSLHKEGSR